MVSIKPGTRRRAVSPPVARALKLLIDELNATPAHLPGDNRPCITTSLWREFNNGPSPT